MLQRSQQIGVVCPCELCYVQPVSIGNHRKFYCEVFCICRYVNIINNDSPTVVVIKFLVPWFCSFFRKTENIFVSCVLGFHRSQSQRIAAQTSQPLWKSSTCATLMLACRLLLRRLGLFSSIGVQCRKASSAAVPLANTCMETSLKRENQFQYSVR